MTTCICQKTIYMKYVHILLFWLISIQFLLIKRSLVYRASSIARITSRWIILQSINKSCNLNVDNMSLRRLSASHYRCKLADLVSTADIINTRYEFWSVSIKEWTKRRIKYIHTILIYLCLINLWNFRNIFNTLYTLRSILNGIMPAHENCFSSVCQLSLFHKLINSLSLKGCCKALVRL